jgi:hypothetical protein
MTWTDGILWDHTRGVHEYAEFGAEAGRSFLARYHELTQVAGLPSAKWFGDRGGAPAAWLGDHAWVRTKHMTCTWIVSLLVSTPVITPYFRQQTFRCHLETLKQIGAEHRHNKAIKEWKSKSYLQIGTDHQHIKEWKERLGSLNAKWFPVIFVEMVSSLCEIILKLGNILSNGETHSNH